MRGRRHRDLHVGPVDATDRGAANETFPPCDIRLIPTTYTQVGGSATLMTMPQGPFCSIVGIPGTVLVPPTCAVGGCSDNDNSAATMGTAIPLPWKFNHLGQVVKSVNMNSNGFLSLGAGQFAANSANSCFPGLGEPEATLAPFWDDLEGDATSGMFYRVDGAPGCRVMTFEWAGFKDKTGTTSDCITAGGNISFQVKLFEGGAGALPPGCALPPFPPLPGDGNDRIEFWYDHAGFVPPALPFDATIGYENSIGTVAAALVGCPAAPGPPVTIGGITEKVVIDPCDCGTVRYYGDPSAVPSLGCLPEIKTNCVPPVIGNPFGLQVVGATPGGSAFLAISAGPTFLPPPFKLPVPCGGLPTSFGTLWVPPFGLIILPCGTTSPGGPCEGCCAASLPIPNDPTLICGTVYAQFAVVSLTPIGVVFELTEGAKIVIG